MTALGWFFHVNGRMPSLRRNGAAGVADRWFIDMRVLRYRAATRRAASVFPVSA
jgi:hypothetical protein